jgi:dihydrofolate reductase
VGNIALSLDGRIAGPGGHADMGWVVAHALSDESRDHLASLHAGATTALLGRRNFEGFRSYWPAVARDEQAEPRDRAFARWLDDVEKVVVIAAGELDRFSVMHVPELLGAGRLLFEADEGLPRSSWRLSSSRTAGTGAIWAVYEPSSASSAA